MATLSLRKTHRYVAGWAHEDEWVDIGTFEVVAKSDPIVDEDDICEGTMQVRFVDVCVERDGDPNEGVPVADVKSALQSAFGGSSCQHEYDCCGCWSTYATATHIKEGLWRVETRSSRNY